MTSVFSVFLLTLKLDSELTQRFHPIFYCFANIVLKHTKCFSFYVCFLFFIFNIRFFRYSQRFLEFRSQYTLNYRQCFILQQNFDKKQKRFHYQKARF